MLNLWLGSLDSTEATYCHLVTTIKNLCGLSVTRIRTVDIFIKLEEDPMLYAMTYGNSARNTLRVKRRQRERTVEEIMNMLTRRDP